MRHSKYFHSIEKDYNYIEGKKNNSDTFLWEIEKIYNIGTI